MICEQVGIIPDSLSVQQNSPHSDKERIMSICMISASGTFNISERHSTGQHMYQVLLSRIGPPL